MTIQVRPDFGQNFEKIKISVLARRYGKNCEALRAAKPDQIESEKKFYDSITRKGAICLIYFFRRPDSGREQVE